MSNVFFTARIYLDKVILTSSFKLAKIKFVYSIKFLGVNHTKIDFSSLRLDLVFKLLQSYMLIAIYQLDL